VFWIWDENNVGNILMFSVVARQSGILSAAQAGLACQAYGKQGAGPSRDSGPKLPAGILHTMLSASAGGAGQGGAIAAWGGLGIVHPAVSNCICALLVLCIYYYYYYYYNLFLCFAIRLSLSQPTSFYFFLFSSPFRRGKRRNK